MNLLKIFFILLVIKSTTLNATHVYSGNITYKRVSAFTYEFKVAILTESDTDVLTEELPVFISSNNAITDQFNVFRSSFKLISPETIQHIFVFEYIFPAADEAYSISCEVISRAHDIINTSIPDSHNTPMVLTADVYIDPFDSDFTDASVTFPDEEIVQAFQGEKFKFHIQARRSDSDSLSYQLIAPKAELDWSGFFIPDNMQINRQKGDLIWDTPSDTGLYVISIMVEEWQEGFMIGRSMKDLFINVNDNNLSSSLELDNDSINGNTDSYFVLSSMKSDTLVASFHASANNDSISLDYFTDIPDTLIIKEPFFTDTLIENGRYTFFGEVYIKTSTLPLDSIDYLMVLSSGTENNETEDASFLLTSEGKALVGLEITNTQNEWVIYPNPAQDFIRFKKINQGTYTMLTSDGRVVSSGRIHHQGQYIPISNLQTGSYIINLNADGKAVTTTFVKD